MSKFALISTFLMCLILPFASNAGKPSTHLANIKSALHKVFPEENIAVQYMNNTVILSGKVSNVDVAEKAENVAKALAHDNTKILNFMNLKTSQQVLLRVRVGQVAKKVSSNMFNGSNNFDKLHSDGILKIVAEPNLVAMSGQTAEFSSGGEIAIPSGSGEIIFKQYGIKLNFTPKVISANLIRLNVAPEVTSINDKIKTGNNVPAIVGHKTNTTVEMAPGESFMVSGLVSDREGNGWKNLDEIVVSVTPFIVDPAHNSDISLPTDNMAVPNEMEMKFIDNLNSKASMTSKASLNINEKPGLEGPSGFVTQ